MLQLVAQDQAYYCFCTSERLAKMRAAQTKQGLPPQYDQTCLKLSDSEVKARLAKGEQAAIRMKVPASGEIIVHDVLRGEVKFAAAVVDDQVLLKSDGYPTYHLAVIVDDHLMNTHIW
jgi:glutamyl-tRNA synthetase